MCGIEQTIYTMNKLFLLLGSPFLHTLLSLDFFMHFVVRVYLIHRLFSTLILHLYFIVLYKYYTLIMFFVLIISIFLRIKIYYNLYQIFSRSGSNLKKVFSFLKISKTYLRKCMQKIDEI